MSGFSAESVGSIHGTLDLDRDPFSRGLEAARAQVKAFEDARHRVIIDAALQGLDTAKAQIAAIHDKTVKIKMVVDRSQLAGLRGAGGVTVTDKGALAKIAELKAALAGVHDKTVKVTVDTQKASLDLGFLKTKWGAIGAVAATVGPQIAGALGQGALGAGALGVATGGAALSFGVLGKAVQDTLSGQATQYTQLKAIATAQKQLTTLQNAGATATVQVAAAQAALVSAEKSGNAARIQMAQQHLAIVMSSTQSQLQGNQALIQAAKQHLAALQADYNGQNQLAQKVNTSISDVKNSIESALAPAVQQVLHGMLPLLDTLKGALGGLSGPFKVLGEAVRKALADPATQAGIRSLVDGFGQVVKASAPLAGPIIRGMISLGKIFEHIAKAAMPVLVGAVKDFVGWLGKMANTTGTPKFAAEIKRWSEGFVTLVKDVGKVINALAPLFASAAGFQPVLNAVIAIASGFTHLLEKAGPVGRLFLGGLGIALIASRFNALKPLLAVTGGAFKLFGAGVLGLLTGSFGPLLGAFPKLATAFWALDGLLAGPVVASFAAAALAVAPFVAAVVGIGALVFLVIHFHKQIFAAIKWAWNAIKDAVVWVVHAIVDVVKAGFKLMEKIVVDVGKAIGKAVSAAWDWIKHAVENAVKFIGKILSEAWKAIEKAASAAWKWLEHAVSDGVKAVVGFVAKLPGKILSALGDIGKLLWDVGVKLIQGFINGIASMFSAVAGVMGQLVQKVLDLVTSGFGLWSPSKVAHSWGHNIGLGLANGIKASIPHVLGATAQLVSSVNAGLSGLTGGQKGVVAPPSAAALASLAQQAAYFKTPQGIWEKAVAQATLAGKYQSGLTGQGSGSSIGSASSSSLSSVASTLTGSTGNLAPALGSLRTADERLTRAVQKLTDAINDKDVAHRGLQGAPAGAAVVVNYQTLVPATPADLRRLSGAVVNAHRRTGPPPPPKRSWGRGW